MKNIKILDCTLRDGGYYNDWDFSLPFAHTLIASLNEAGVDVVEIGYKSLVRNKYYGLFHYCNEKMLQFLNDYDKCEYAFMIDVKEFVKQDKSINYTGLDSIVLDKKDSVFSIVRIACHFAEVLQAIEMIGYFKLKGYKVCFNLMGGSLLSDEQITYALEQLAGNQLEAFYIADSFGSFYPHDIKRLIDLIKSKYNGPIGIHTHDNQGMAYANTLAAIDAGVDYIDGTVTGMGRGAGNLILEQFIQGYSEITASKKLKPGALLDVIHDFVLPLKEKYNWGYNYVYMLSGLKNIHPSYCQTLGEGNRYTMPQMTAILDKIPHHHRSKFNVSILTDTIKEVLESDDTVENEIPIKSYTTSDNKLGSKEVLIIAGGSSVLKHEKAIKHYLSSKDCELIECNNTGKFEDVENKLLIILNKVKLNNFVSQRSHNLPQIITGQHYISKELFNDKILKVDYQLEDFDVIADKVKIPDYDAGMFAVAVAMLRGANKIYLAGFDGFEDEEKNSRMESFFQKINDKSSKLGIELLAVTPTNYKNLAKTSIYSIL